MSFILSIIMCSLVGAAPAQETANRVPFPSQRKQAVSANGRFAVVNVDADTDPYHTLFLEDRNAKSRRKILEYGRQVEILWNPQSNLFAVTDYAGSNVAECLVFQSLGDHPPVNVADEIQRTITNPKELAALQKNDNIYYAAVRWISPRALRVKVWGRGDESPSGFSRFFTVRLKDN